MHLVFHRGKGLSFSNKEMQPKNFIRGQLSKPNVLTRSGRIDMIAIVFHPLGLNPFIQMPINEIYNQYLDIENIGDAGLNNLIKIISDEEDIHVCLQFIESFLLRRIKKSDYNYERILHSIQTIKRESHFNINSLAQDACLGYRHFKRVFTEYVGMNPKEYCRVVRFQRALYILQNTPDLEITKLSYLCGYYDHSHLVKDFQTLSGCSPKQYIASRIPHSTFFSNDCKINRIKDIHHL